MNNIYDSKEDSRIYDDETKNINKVRIIGNINAKNIDIKEVVNNKGEKNYLVKYSIAVSSEKDKPAQWHNITQFVKEGSEPLNQIKEIQSSEKSPQVSVLGNLTANIVVKDDLPVTYYNINAYTITKTDKFMLPKATIELAGELKSNAFISEREDGKQFSALEVKVNNKFFNTKNPDEPVKLFVNAPDILEKIEKLKSGTKIYTNANLIQDNKIVIRRDSTLEVERDAISKPEILVGKPYYKAVSLIKKMIKENLSEPYKEPNKIIKTQAHRTKELTEDRQSR